jgi:hypothetical protein
MAQFIRSFARYIELNSVASDAVEVLIKAQHNSQSKWL